MKVCCLEPRLVLPAETMMTEFVPACLARFPRLPLIDSFFDLPLQILPLFVCHHLLQALSTDLTTCKRT
jgi:hypothetical protein